jgi:hypothetical protein
MCPDSPEKSKGGENTPSSSLLDSLTKLVTLISLVIAVFAAWKALPVDTEIKLLQAETHRLDLALKKADADLKSLESTRKVTLELYTEVKKVIEKKEKEPREEEAVRVLIESLADDPFRWKLLRVLAVGARDRDVQKNAAATSKFYEEESVGQAGTMVLPPSGTAAKPVNAGAYNVDFFFCEEKHESSEALARKALALKTPSDTGRWRIRALPQSINQQPGYGITSNVIRFTPPEEKPVADYLYKSLADIGIKVQLHETSYPTPGRIGVFICQ